MKVCREVSLYTVNAHALVMLQISCCPGCRKALPRCAVCLGTLGTASIFGANAEQPPIKGKLQIDLVKLTTPSTWNTKLVTKSSTAMKHLAAGWCWVELEALKPGPCVKPMEFPQAFTQISVFVCLLAFQGSNPNARTEDGECSCFPTPVHTVIQV